ncbi:UDP-N-acetylglucosamine--LPS N-acetylglucosamine transferase [Paenibacillus sp. GSMTC-2017]|uniref:MGDG synthase family glycosyltransferase n=1 Tax=Paenibacillus sp. GSMTC-2017 TaxID=2794350 RepID=UPI0018D6E5A4|nr:glycosyltransferase [Paenibacillus sp. GSMTC-2017]MBH5319123.1 UDP-N-acetylglucosamine--LPS N-acetylglucosamine transferase [Paenibacillus sp. GSMTC-2017]
MRKKRVLLLSEGFGSGHTQAAYALAVGLKQLCPNISARVIELGKFLNPVMGPLIISAYRKTVSSQPKMVGLMYRSNYKKPTNRFAQLALHRVFYTKTSQVIAQLKPDLIICTHPIPNTVVSRLKRSGLNIPLYTLITDYDAHGSWVNPEVDHFLVASDEVKQRLVEKGVQKDRVEVTGIPVHPNFWNIHTKEEVQIQYELKDIPTVLVMGGGWGILYEDNALSYMTKWRETTQLIFCVGSNEKMKEKMLADPLFQHPNIRIVGFTREIHKLMDAADLLITKPGGMTCTEGMSKGLPMLFYEPIPGQEEENCEYFIQSGYGEMLTSNDTVDRWFHLIHNREAATLFREELMLKRNLQYDPMRCPKAVLQFMQ